MSMKPLNQQERNNTFIRYILALVVSMLLFGALFFTGSRLPQKELDVLRAQNAEYKNAIDKQAKMLSLMDSIEANLAVLDKSEADASYGETEVNNLLVQLKTNVTDSSGINLVYKKVAANYQRTLQDKHMIRSMRKDNEAAGQYKTELDKAKEQIMDYQKMLLSMGANVPK